MSLTDALLLLAFILANMAAGAISMFRYAQVSSILAQRHPDLWRTFQGYSFAARDAAGRFYCSRAPFRLNDPELSRAVIRSWIATGVWIAVILAAFATAVVRGG
ncbi:hypothetical protein [Caulobacter sp. UNC358MFTsu5.1]|uniref:hypothetical protein n=1 Tax=Caulobacter sp. UNC358MFTsu5.1 TaxID=1449049 RepID=UPI0004A6B298|nr:hypothetical protein [Caulobacter sp. UNC358MFTsu5.1]